MLFNCSCGFGTDDETDFLAHLVDCSSEPEEKWGTYADIFTVGEQPFKNSEILEEEKT
jgi:hypothetical protein